MWTKVRQVSEPRALLVAEPVEKSVGQERRRRQVRGTIVLDGERGDRVVEVVAVLVQPLQPWQLPTAHVEHRIKAR
jgi:hypothetical protein